MKSRKGFTLVELIVATSIFVVITGLVLMNFRVGQRNELLRSTVQDIISVAEKAQSLTLTGQMIDGQFPRGGYGVRFSSVTPFTCVVFADFNKNLVYDSGEEIEGGIYSLPPRIKITGLSPAVETVDLIFKPSRAEILINGRQEAEKLVVGLKHADTEKAAGVVVDRVSGRIFSE